MTGTQEESGITVTIRGPSALKLSLNVTLDMSVHQLKQKIEETNKEFRTDSGKVLKDPDTLESYQVQNGHTIHMVRGAARTTPDAGTTAQSATRTAESQGVPANLSSGQQFTNNPLSALNRADYAGPHMASLLNEAGGMFGNFGGMNPRDPNVMLGMMQNPEFLQHMREMLSQPEVVDHIIASNPQMQAMGPHMRELLRSEQFQEMVTNPESIQRIAQLSQVLGGAGAGAGAGLGGARAANDAGETNPPPNLFAALGGLGGMGGGANMDSQQGLAQLQQMLGQSGGAANPLAGLVGQGGGAANPLAALAGLGGLGGAPSAPSAPTDTRAPEERFAAQLEQLQGMGFYDAAANLRALLLSGGSVEGAVSVLIGN
ncbi:hypothetical protein MVES1_003915 [Malassezia vespertilionis]|uniref:uncharacterized protein n=1 Tax=Malassezia vespertilionis TaxID=2020962 RepID=UPI0024B1319F|nr:uncharacterized protein MVES1_003915 [Malassezia vespertilionis]WFD08539.1 hypothetical protein MVES1_003915 [Malassezia vespertilionis]